MSGVNPKVEALFAKWSAENVKRTCNVDGCPNYRHTQGRYCSKHYERQQSYGHPFGRKIHYAEYRVERSKCRSLIANNPDHKGIQTAVRYFNRWMELAHSGDESVDFPTAQFNRLYEEGATGEELLAEACAITLFLRNNWREPEINPEDAPPEHYHIQLALAVMTYRADRMWEMLPQIKPIGVMHIKKKDRRIVGKTLKNDLGKLLSRIPDSISRFEKTSGVPFSQAEKPFKHEKAQNKTQ